MGDIEEITLAVPVEESTPAESVQETIGEPVEESVQGTDQSTEAQGARADTGTDETPAADVGVGPADDLDEIAPTPSGPEAIVPEAGPLPGATVPTWPFYAYLGAWIVLVSVAVWQLLELPDAVTAYESQAYGFTVLGGLIMTAVGPLLILAVWFTVRNSRSEGNRSGLLTSALLKGASTTLIGAVIWWAALIVVDYIRLGQPL